MKHLILILLLFVSVGLFGQRTTTTDNLNAKTKVTIGNGTKTSGAALDMTGTDGGLLPPKLTSTQRDNLPAVEGLFVYLT